MSVDELVADLRSAKLIISTARPSLAAPVVGKVHPVRPNDWELRPYRAELCELFDLHEIHFAICSNEGGVAWNHGEAWEVGTELWKLTHLLQGKAMRFCPYHSDSRHVRYGRFSTSRFPYPEMLLNVVTDVEITIGATILLKDVRFLYSLDEEFEAAESIAIKAYSAQSVFTREVLEAFGKA